MIFPLQLTSFFVTKMHLFGLKRSDVLERLIGLLEISIVSIGTQDFLQSYHPWFSDDSDLIVIFQDLMDNFDFLL